MKIYIISSFIASTIIIICLAILINKYIVTLVIPAFLIMDLFLKAYNNNNNNNIKGV